MKRITSTFLFIILMISLCFSVAALPEAVMTGECAWEGAALSGDGVVISLGSRASDTNKRYAEICGEVTEIAENNDEYTVPYGEENLLVEVVEKNEAGGVVKAQYFFVDMTSKSAVKLSMDSYMHAYDEKSVRVKDPMGIRFKAHISTAAKAEDTQFVIDEYGYVITTKKALGDNELTLGFDVKAVGVGYNKEKNIDVVYEMDDEKHIFTGVLKDIPVKEYKTDLVCKTYTKITVAGDEFVLYGEPVTGNVYDTAKPYFSEDYTNTDVAEIIFDYVSLAGADAAYTNSSAQISIKRGRIQVEASFDSTSEEAETYNIYLVTYDDDGNILKVEKSSDKTMVKGTNKCSETFEVEGKQQITKAFVLTSDAVSVCEPCEKTIKVLRILSIGNSFSVDAQQYLYGIATAGGYDHAIIGNLYIGGCSLQSHYNNSVSGNAAYTYYKNTGAWSTYDAKTLEFGITDEDWDYITLQQNSGNSGAASTYDPYLTDLVKYVNSKKNNPDAELLWHMTWAYDEAYAATSNYGSQAVMYSRIIGAVKEKIVGNNDFSMIIPAGTAVQNARTSFIGDTFNRDGFHLDYNYGRYLAGLTWFHKITGLPIDDIDYIPSGSFSQEYLEVLKEAAKNAVLNPFEVTNSKYTDSEIDLENDYVELDWQAQGIGYYNSTSSSAPVTTASNSKNFVYSKIFSKDELPNGTVIVIDAGYQYRPEGWITLSTANAASSRPANVTAGMVEITDAWWGDFNYRAFNVAVSGNSADLTDRVDEVAAAFRIYIPKELWNGDDGEEEETAAGLIDWEPMKDMYYNSLGSSVPSTSEGNKNRFICSKVFTKDELPAGTVIEIDEGYQYRPEGWVDLDTKNSVRPDNVTTHRVVVDEAWWGDYNYRAFNISKTDLSDICTDFEESCSHFRIYVPLRNEIDIPVEDLYD